MNKIHKEAFLNEKLIKECNYKLIIRVLVVTFLIITLILPISVAFSNATNLIEEFLFEYGLILILIYLNLVAFVFIIFSINTRIKIKKKKKLNWRIEFIVENNEITYITGDNYSKEVANLKSVFQVIQTKNLIILGRGRYKEAFIIPKACFNENELNEFLNILNKRFFNRKRKD